MEGSYPLCLLCCYSSSPSTSSSPDTQVEEVETLSKFIRGSEFFKSRGLSAEGLMWGMDGVSLCGHCLSEVAATVEKREKVEEVETQVRQLQQQLLRLMGVLKGTVDAYLEEVDKLQDKISCSDETCLKIRIAGKEKSKRDKKKPSFEEDAFAFRQGILSGVTALKQFRGDLSTKFPCPSAANLQCSSGDENDHLEVKEEPAELSEDGDPPPWSPEVEPTPASSRRRASKSSWSCPHCPKVFRLKLDLKKHLQSAHPELAPKKPRHKCDLCERSFASSSSLVNHRKGIHHQRKDPEACAHCGKVLKWKYLKMHPFHCPVQKALLPPTICQLCGISLKSKYQLSGHLRNSCPGNRKEAMLSCEICGKGGFWNEHNLKKHKRKHVNWGKREYVCERCGGDFNCSSHLARHKKRCDGSKKPRKPRWSNMCQPLDAAATENMGK